MKYFFILLCLFQANASYCDVDSTLDQVVSAFENGTTQVQYDYIEDIHDGRGFTAGKAGFTTATGDFWELIKKYHDVNDQSAFIPFEAILKDRAEKESGSTRGLGALPKIWRKACADKKFIKAQDDLVISLYKTPARRFIDKYKLTSKLAYLIFYDSVIQQGDGDDPDGFNGIIKGMGERSEVESEFLLSFLASRRGILLNPHNEDTKDEWVKSVDRVDALERLVRDGNWDLTVPFQLRVWEKNFTIK
jgi:chitosanase